MKDSIRQLCIRALILVATTIAVMGFTWTEQYAFVLLPFFAGVALAVLVAKAPAIEESSLSQRRAVRRRGLFQLMVSSAVLFVFIIVSAAEGWGWERITGYSIMLATMLLLAGLGYLSYRRTQRKLVGTALSDPLSCRELKKTGRVYADEETDSERA
jgi:hypothetical protein